MGGNDKLCYMKIDEIKKRNAYFQFSRMTSQTFGI